LTPSEGAHADADGAMFLGEANLRRGLGRGQRRHYTGPAQAILAELPDIRQPAVPAPTERDLHFRAARERPQPERVVEHLHVDPQRVHVSQPLGHIADLPGLHRSSHFPAESFDMLFGLLLVGRGKLGAEILAVENPMLPLGIIRLGYERRAIFFFTGVEIIPYARVLYHMRV